MRPKGSPKTPGSGRRPRHPLQRIRDLTLVGGPTDCFIYDGTQCGRGRTQIKIPINNKGRSFLVHRVAYEHLVGPIPDGYTIDHLCGVPRCWNPLHLEAVPLRENIRRYAVQSGFRLHKLMPGEELSATEDQNGRIILSRKVAANVWRVEETIAVVEFNE